MHKMQLAQCTGVDCLVIITIGVNMKVHKCCTYLTSAITHVTAVPLKDQNLRWYRSSPMGSVLNGTSANLASYSASRASRSRARFCCCCFAESCSPLAALSTSPSDAAAASASSCASASSSLVLASSTSSGVALSSCSSSPLLLSAGAAQCTGYCRSVPQAKHGLHDKMASFCDVPRMRRPGCGLQTNEGEALSTRPCKIVFVKMYEGFVRDTKGKLHVRPCIDAFA